MSASHLLNLFISAELNWTLHSFLATLNQTYCFLIIPDTHISPGQNPCYSFKNSTELIIEVCKQSPHFEPSNEGFLHYSMLSIGQLTAFDIISSDIINSSSTHEHLCSRHSKETSLQNNSFGTFHESKYMQTPGNQQREEANPCCLRLQMHFLPSHNFFTSRGF